ncbi:MAG: biotin/lipoyl-containing protein [Isosphaeraceae bacterium]|jgi:pyruvate/2-oxoglutarate dehydrogenase complex dihydrolipoamide acyltransferase (E2) component
MRKAAVILPDLGTGPDTPIVVSYWFAARGETVWEGERLVEVLVGPATFDVPAPATGRLVEIRLREDDTLLPGAMLGCIAVLDEDSDDESKDEPDPGSDDHDHDHDHDRDPRDRPRRSGHRPT